MVTIDAPVATANTATERGGGEGEVRGGGDNGNAWYLDCVEPPHSDYQYAKDKHRRVVDFGYVVLAWSGPTATIEH